MSLFGDDDLLGPPPAEPSPPRPPPPRRRPRPPSPPPAAATAPDAALLSVPALLAAGPGGTAFGTFAHTVFEATDFAAADLDAELARGGQRGAARGGRSTSATARR